MPASSPAEAVQKLRSRGVKGFKESDAYDDSTPRQPAGDKPAEEKSEAYKSGERHAISADKRQQQGYEGWKVDVSGYDDESLIAQRKSLQENIDDFESDIKRYDRDNLSGAVYKKRIDANNYQIGGLKAIDEEIKHRGIKTGDSAPLTGDTRLNLSQVKNARRTYKAVKRF